MPERLDEEMMDRYEALAEENLGAWMQPDVTGAVETRRGTLVNGPERRLMVAVLEDAVNRFRKYAGAKTVEGKAILTEEEQWFFGRDEDGPFSFESICDALGIDADYLRSGLRRFKLAQHAPRLNGNPISPQLSMVPLLLGEDIPAPARRALVNHRPGEAGRRLMKEYGLTCDEAALLVGANPCANSVATV
jgi:hypothetical protein